LTASNTAGTSTVASVRTSILVKWGGDKVS
jgi:hypothetical protein